MRVYSAEDSERFLTPLWHSSGYRFWSPSMSLTESGKGVKANLTPWSVAEVRASYDRLSAKYEPWFIPTDYGVFCLDLQLYHWDEDRNIPWPGGGYWGERFTGCIAFSYKDPSLKLDDLFGHELAHELERQFAHATPTLFALFGLDAGNFSSNDEDWGKDREEIAAELISWALWEQPVNQLMLAQLQAAYSDFKLPDPAKVRAWADALKTAPRPVHPAVLPAQAQEVVLTIGSDKYILNGAEHEMELPTDAPFIKDDRTFTPVRYVAEGVAALFGKRVKVEAIYKNGLTHQVRITKDEQ